MANKKEERYYHYTDDKGIKGIEEKKQIDPCTNTATDAVAGKGVYFTKKGPRTKTDNLLDNNYDGMYPKDRERVKHVVSVPTKDLPNAIKVDKPGRDVYVNPGPVNLRGVDYKVHHKNVNKK